MRHNPVHPITTRRRPGGRPARAAAGFTLMELLIVVLIIGVLISIAIPMVSKARQQVQAANTRALVANLGTLITAYQGDFSAYPGPLSNLQVCADMNGATPDIGDGDAPDSVKMEARQTFITMSENLVLGLNGGLRRVNSDGEFELQYDTAWVGAGPQWLGGTPRKLPPYGGNSTKALSTRNLATAAGNGPVTGRYMDGNEVLANDTAIPEYVDPFAEPMPIIYCRARPGSRTTGNTPDDNPVITDGSDASRVGQYDYSQYRGYIEAENAATNIGVGKLLRAKDYVGLTFPQHGLRPPVVTATTDPASGGYTYPYNAYAAFRNHGISGPPGAAPPDNPPETPKQKDAYILISAGIDRVYGTSDDITNFGSY